MAVLVVGQVFAGKSTLTVNKLKFHRKKVAQVVAAAKRRKALGFHIVTYDESKHLKSVMALAKPFYKELRQTREAPYRISPFKYQELSKKEQASYDKEFEVEKSKLEWAYNRFGFDYYYDKSCRGLTRELSYADIAKVAVVNSRRKGVRVCGFALADSIRERSIFGDSAKLFSLVASPQGKGYGSRLLSEIERQAAPSKGSKIVIGVVPENVGARRFYERHGYTLSKYCHSVDVFYTKKRK